MKIQRILVFLGVLLFCTGAVYFFYAPDPGMMVLLLLSELLLGISCFRYQKLDKLMKLVTANAKKVRWTETEEESLHLIRKRIEYSTLQSQINPHFLYNTLDTIRSKALVDGNQEIAKMTEALSKFFRYCISTQEGMIKMREEIIHIQNYFFIQQCRFGNRFMLEIHEGSPDILDCYIPKMTLQPLVENAMVHGLENVTHDGKIIIHIERSEKTVEIKVFDNGAGMSVDELERVNEKLRASFIDISRKKGRHNGIALSNVNSRIKVTFGEEYGIHYRSMKGYGTEACIYIPYVDEFARAQYESIWQTEGSL